MRLLDLKLLVVDYQIAEFGGHICHVGRERDIVYRLVGGHQGVFHVGHVHHLAAGGDHVDVAVVIHHHQIFLVGVVVYLAYDGVVKVVAAVKRLVFLRLLVVAKQVVAHQIIHLVASVDNVLRFLPRKHRVHLPVAHAKLSVHAGRRARQHQGQQQ